MRKKAILVISFGTSYEETRKKTIGKIEEKIKQKFTDYHVVRAFTSKMIINKLKKRDGLSIDNPREALNKLLEQGYEEIIIQPTHIINGLEFESLFMDALYFKNKFKSLKLGRPLLNIYDDYLKVVRSMVHVFPKDIDERIIILMGHGTEHSANAAYPCLDYVFKNEGYENVHIATVEGFPSLETVLTKINKIQIKNVTLIPLMIVAGDHVQEDMVGDDEDSWKNILIEKGYNVDSILIGMGEIQGIQKVFIEHLEKATKI
ncbi:MAG: sirohydrochlorin cobaltochelatase [Eubacteriaceae bacterium]